MNKKRIILLILGMIGTVFAAAAILTVILNTVSSHAFSYSDVMAIVFGAIGIYFILKVGKGILDYLSLMLSYITFRNNLKKDLAEKEKILNKHFPMFDGDKHA